MLANAHTLVPAETEISIPQNGHELFGRFQDASDKQVVLVLDAGSPVTLSWNQVKQLEIRHKTSLQARSLPAPGSTPEAMDFGSLTIATTNEKLLIRSPARILLFHRQDLVQSAVLHLRKRQGRRRRPHGRCRSAPLQASSRVRTSSRPRAGTATSDVNRIRSAQIGAIKPHLSRSTHFTASSEGAARIRFQQYTGCFEHTVFLYI
jgi:hypothetical protein